MSLIALLKTCISLLTDYSFTVYRWMEDGGWRMEDGGWRMEDGGWRMEDGGWRMGKTTTENENLNRNLHMEKDKYETREHK